VQKIHLITHHRKRNSCKGVTNCLSYSCHDNSDNKIAFKSEFISWWRIKYFLLPDIFCRRKSQFSLYSVKQIQLCVLFVLS
jgi:hypothetical protein